MTGVLFDILIIAVLIFANGLFAMSEIAVVSARKTRLRTLSNRGDRGAGIALQLANEPGRFLSTIQVGITLVGISAGAIAGATLADRLSGRLSLLPGLEPYADALGLGAVVLAVTYCNLILGELVPKRIALNAPERISAAIAQPMTILSALASPLVRFLSYSTDVVLRALRMRRMQDPVVTEEEVRLMIQQGAEAGVLAEVERELLESVLRLGERRVSSLMTSKDKIIWVDADASLNDMRATLAAGLYSHFPVATGSLDNLVGVVRAKDLLDYSMSGRGKGLKSIIRNPLYVREDETALRALELLRKERSPVALVMRESGRMAGILSISDILVGILGELPISDSPAPPADPLHEAERRVLDGRSPVDHLAPLAGEMADALADEDSLTISAFVTRQLGRDPRVGDTFKWNELRFEVITVNGAFVDKLLVSRVAGETDSDRQRG